MNFEIFTEQFLTDIRNDSILGKSTPSMQFLESMVNQLESMEYLVDPIIMPFEKAGSSNRIFRLDALAIDDSDKSLALVTNDFVDDLNPGTLTQQEINSLVTRMLNYVDEVMNETYVKFIDESLDIFNHSKQLNRRLSPNFYNLDTDVSIDKIKLFIMTNKKISSRVTNLKWDDFREKQVEVNVWDIRRIFEVYELGKDKEPILIDIAKHNKGRGLEYLKANFEHNTDYDSYLCVLPGKLLSDIYWEHGSRLLEGNVRAFLSARGNVNKGIRNTILKAPDKFFTYNNGIACTAKSIELSADKKQIIRIEDLQIINGGQTTASLTNAWKKDGSKLDNIFVPMKLTIVYSDDYEDMVSKISRFANSQNKVTESDFFSNHPFHQTMESISKTLLAPPKTGQYYSTIWYYERSRGKYMQEQFKITSKRGLDDFLLKHPKNQVIAKEDFAKYIVSAEFKRPDIVSQGRQKNMKFYGEYIEKNWDNNKSIYNSEYYKTAVCYGILYKTIDNVVKNAQWYSVGGIKLNIVPYTLSKLMTIIPEGYSLDFDQIWRKQDLYPSLYNSIETIAKVANDFINDSNGMIVTEYAKKEDTWHKFNKVKIDLDSSFFADLVNKILFDERVRSAKKSAAEAEKLNIDVEVANLAMTEDGKYWDRLLIEGAKYRLLNGKEVDIIKNYVCELSKPNPRRIPSSSQCKIAWQARARLGDNGINI